MAVRKPFVGGNWKMNPPRTSALSLAGELTQRFTQASQVDVAVYVPFPYLETVGQVLRDARSAIMLGAQDFYHQPNGAFTGEVSLSMLKDLGVSTVLVGHSERRHVIGESDILLNQKVLAGLEADMHVVLCIGEKIEQREANQTDAINRGQLAYGLAGVTADQLSQITIAYEPVWAIGTGKTASAGDAQSAHQAIREALGQWYGSEAADSVRIQYGGSVKAANAPELFGEVDIDGGLIGGAALKADDFMPIVEAAAQRMVAAG